MTETPGKYFDLDRPGVAELFAGCVEVWDVLRDLDERVDSKLAGRRVIRGRVSTHAEISDGPVYIAASAVIEPGVYIEGRAYVGEGVHLRQGAYVRDGCLFLDGSMLGHAGEAKGSIFLPGARAPHFAYVGDSVLGSHVNLGAGTKLSNATMTRTSGSTVRIPVAGEMVDTGLRKFGAILGDDVQTGCNCVTSPGTVVGPKTLIYAGAVLPKGVYPARRVVKLRQKLETVELLDPASRPTPAD